MKFRVVHGVPLFSRSTHLLHNHHHRRCFTSLLNKLHKTTATPSRASLNGGTGGGSKGAGDWFLLPGATVATVLMLGALHSRRIYEDMKAAGEENGNEVEFRLDVKSIFLRLLPLRAISRRWGVLTGNSSLVTFTCL